MPHICCDKMRVIKIGDNVKYINENDICGVVERKNVFKICSVVINMNPDSGHPDGFLKLFFCKEVNNLLEIVE